MHLALSGSVTVVYYYHNHHHHHFDDDDDDDGVVVELRLGICQIFHCSTNNRQKQQSVVSAQICVHAMKTDRESGGKSTIIFNLDIRWTGLSCSRASCFMSAEWVSSTNFIEGYADHRSGRFVEEKSFVTLREEELRLIWRPTRTV